MIELTDKKMCRTFYYKNFDSTVNCNENELDLVYRTLMEAERVFVVDSASEIPSKKFGQLIKYRFSIANFDFHTDAYRETVYIVKPPEAMNETFDLEDTRDILLKAADCKCKLTQFDIEEASDKEALIRCLEKDYQKLLTMFGDKLKLWRYTEEGVQVKLTDKKIISIDDEDLYESDSVQESWKNELEQRAKHHRKHQYGLSPFCSLGESLEIYNGTDIPDFDYTQINLADSREIGLHCGTEQACKDKGYKYINKLIISNENILALDTDMSGYWSDLSVLKYLESIFSEDELAELHTQMRSFAGEESDIKYKNYSTILRNAILSKGYNIISYPNNVEDVGSTSYIILDSSIIDKPVVESRKKKKPYDSINTDAGNVEHNINMFNHMNNPAESPSTNPTGPMAEDMKKSANEYTITYHKNTASKERRRETKKDIEKDWHVDTMRATSDLDALQQACAMSLERSVDSIRKNPKFDSEFDCITYLDECDWGDGSPIIIKVDSPTKTIYDSGYDKESWIEEYAYENHITEDVADENMLQESSSDEYIELEYDDIEIFVVTRRGSPSGYFDRNQECWYPDEDDGYDTTIDWTYKVSKEDILDYLYCHCLDDICTDEHEDMTDDEFDAWILQNFDNLVTRFEDKIKDHWREAATEDAEENYDPDDYVDWDSIYDRDDD